MEIFMKRCIELALSAEGLTAPNPMVGAVLVYDNRIIAEGRHAFYGAPHAEPDAISKVRDTELLKKSTLYVNLEPCRHYGKTPPCTEKIISSGIKRAVIAAVDTSAKVNGAGIRALNEAGVTTEVGILEKEARFLNRFFYTFHEKKRPYILLKWAQTADGFIDSDRIAASVPPLQISNSLTRIFDHRNRSVCQAIMAGTNTVLMDNPRLTVRFWHGKNPLRVTVDRQGRLDGSFNIFDDRAPSLVFAGNPDVNYGTNTELLPFDSLEETVETLRQRNIQSLMVEGGAMLLQSFIDRGLWDEANIFISDFRIGKGVKAPVINSTKVIRKSIGTYGSYTVVIQ
jgi:diaminohydroxyphosphoribosylaminopyrimidine deaminase/5-amino-6-(5-phosphoribosylamino)uracil reductase